MRQYVGAFRHVEAGRLDEAKAALKDLAAKISTAVVTGQQGALGALLDSQLARLG